MLGCLNSRNEKTLTTLEPDLSTIHLHMCDQPELNRGMTKSPVLLDTNVTSPNPSAYLGMLSSPKDRAAALQGRNPEVQSFVLKTFDMAETTKHKDSSSGKGGGEFNTTEKKFLSSFAKGF
jgi:hypothetical protein